MNAVPSLFRDARSELGESPVWDAENHDVWWVDIDGRRVTRSPFDGAVNGSDDTSFTLPTATSAVGLTTRPGTVAVVLRDGIHLADKHGTLSPFAPIEHEHPAYQRFNDGKPDPFGGFVLGSLTERFDGEPIGKLYRVAQDGSVTVLRDGLVNSNGLGWSPDGSIIYYTDSFTRKIYSADYSEAEGLAHERVFASLPESLPDGLTVDSAGHVWLAFPYENGRIVRFDPDGAVERELPAPAELTTSVEFAGPDLRSLIVTTTRHRKGGALAPSDPGAGGLYRIDLDITGTLPYRLDLG